jgi:hypothetical protein
MYTNSPKRYIDETHVTPRRVPGSIPGRALPHLIETVTPFDNIPQDSSWATLQIAHFVYTCKTDNYAREYYSRGVKQYTLLNSNAIFTTPSTIQSSVR